VKYVAPAHSAGTRRHVRAYAKRKKRFYRRMWFWAALATMVVLLPAVWLGIRGWIAKGALESAQTEITTLKTKAAALDIDGAKSSLDLIDANVDTAVELTSDPIWRLAEGFPSLGKNLTAVRELSVATQAVLGEVVEPIIDVVGELDPASLAPRDGAIDLAPFVKIIPAMASAQTALDSSLADIAAIDTTGTIPQLDAARVRVSTLLSSVKPALELANTVLPLLPPALGSEGARRYAVMFQNNAEPRALGGTALSFAVVTVDQGKIVLSSPIPAGSGVFPYFDPPLITFAEGSQNIFPPSSIASFIPNVTTRPSFVTAATVTQAMWERTFGYSLDGVISVDPVFLGYVMRAADPIQLSTGDTLSGDTLVPLLMNTVYQRFNTGDQDADNASQDAVYSEVVSATFARLMGGPLRPPELIAAIQQGWSENRLLIWSARANEEAALATVGLPGELPLSDTTTDRVGVYIQDYVGSKLGYYLQQSVTLAHGVCRPDGRPTERTTLDLTSTVDPAAAESLSPSIVGQWEFEGVKRAQQRLIVMLYAPPGSEFTSVTINGDQVAASGHYDAGYPVDLRIVHLLPGEKVTLSYDVVPIAPGDRVMEAKMTPLVNPTVLVNSPLDCATVPAS